MIKFKKDKVMENFDEKMIKYCAPTLAGIKAGSTFSYAFASEEEMFYILRKINRMLDKSGIKVLPLRKSKDRVLIYVFRIKLLQDILIKDSSKSMLEQFGYICQNPGKCVTHLIDRINNEGEFPHEIGLFLGYPYDDVKGFMDNCASNYKSLGRWKIYGDEQATLALFEKYEKCTKDCYDMWNSGASIEFLAAIN